MTQKELYNHHIATLQRIKGHTIVAHMMPNGTRCFRIRDCNVNPVANIPESVFQMMRDNNIVHKINDREWQLKP